MVPAGWPEGPIICSSSGASGPLRMTATALAAGNRAVERVVELPAFGGGIPGEELWRAPLARHRLPGLGTVAKDSAGEGVDQGTDLRRRTGGHDLLRQRHWRDEERDGDDE